MKTRQLGELSVSAIGLGCMPMAGLYGSASDTEGIAAIRHALDIGVTLLDTADFYGNGSNEELIGRAIADRRDDAIVATKFGIVRDEQGNARGLNSEPQFVRDACEASLRRLGIDTIDLYQQHRIDGRTPIEETVGTLAELVSEGKIRHIGLSEALPEDLRRATKIHPIASVQSEYSLLERGVEDEVLDTCEELGIGFLAYTPLMRGVLSGSLTADTKLEEGDFRAKGEHFPRVSGEHLADNVRLAETVKTIAAARGVSPAQVALSWLLSRRAWIVPIPGTKRREYVDDNSGAIDLELDTNELEQLEPLAAGVHGPRYVAQMPTVSPPLPA